MMPFWKPFKLMVTVSRVNRRKTERGRRKQKYQEVVVGRRAGDG